MKYQIGIDYGYGEDVPSFVVLKQEESHMRVFDSGRLSEFDYRKYVASEHQVVGEKRCLEQFKKDFIK